jgi:hypothetical protein
VPYLDDSGNRIGAPSPQAGPVMGAGKRYLDDNGEVQTSAPSSVAEQARTRLASQGVTPEQVKAKTGEIPPAPDSLPDSPFVRFLRGMGVPTSRAEMEAIGRHFDPIGGTVDDIKNRNYGGAASRLGGPAGQAAYDLLHTIGQEGGQQIGQTIDAAQEAKQKLGEGDRHAAVTAGEKYLGHGLGAAVPLVGPPAAEGDLAGAGGRLTALAAPELIKGIAPTRAGAIETYGKTFGPKADPTLINEVVPRLLDERKIVSDPESLAAYGERLQKSGGPVGVDGKPVTTIDPVTKKFQPRAANPDVKFGEQLSELADSAPGTKGGALGGVGSMAAGYLIHKLMPAGWFIPGMAETIGAAKIAKAIYTSPLFRTTAAVVKDSLAKALRNGNTEAALQIGSRIIGGHGLDDEYGHDPAIHSAVDGAFAKADGNPMVARQLLHSQEAVYVNPDGSEVRVPHHVLSSFVNAIPGTNLQHADSGMAPSNAQGGTGQAGRQADVPQAGMSGSTRLDIKQSSPGDSSGGGLPILERASHRPDAEWPSNPKGNNENDAMLLKTIPSKLLPPQFKNARDVTYGSRIDGKIPVDPSAFAVYGADFPSGELTTVLNGGDYPNNILISRKGADATDVYAHETGHAIYEKDLTPAQRQEWERHHAQVLSSVKSELSRSGITSPRDPNFKAALSQVTAHYPRAIVNYPDSPQESFAESVAQYMSNPKAFRAAHPTDYHLISDFFGRRDYTGGRALDPPRDDAAR